MPHQNTVFHTFTKLIPWASLEKSVAAHGADAKARGLNTRSHLLALLHAQFCGATSLREIETCLSSQRHRLYHLGLRPVKRSTLAEANAGRPWQVFGELFGHMVKQAHPGLRRATREAVRLIDSTTVRLSNLSADWARFSAAACGAKAHIVYDPDADCPVHMVVTPEKVNDITAAKAMPIESGATYVFDLGYYDYGWWAELDRAGCRFVTRLKSNTPLTVLQERDVLPGSPGSIILSERIGRLPARQAASRKNPFQAKVREIRVIIETGKTLRIVTNDLDTPAQEIAELYKRRWAIELFFRWVKQTLKIKHFLGTSENAVRIQIAVALIAFLLLRMAQAACKIVESPLAFARIVRVNLMHRRPLHRLLRPEPEPSAHQSQLSFTWSKT